MEVSGFFLILRTKYLRARIPVTTV